MKRRWTITLLAIPVAVLVAMLLTYRHHTVPLEQCSELYRRYQTVEGVKASYIKDFPVNDTLRVDVVLLEATTDAGWDTLHAHFSLVEESPEFRQLLEEGRFQTLSRLVLRENPSLPMDETNPDNNIVRSIDYVNHTIALFYTKNNQGNLDVLHYNYFNPKTFIL